MPRRCRGIRGDVGIAPYGGELPRHTGRCTPRVLVPLRSTAWASPPTEGSKGCGAKQEFGYRFLAGDVVQWRQGIPGKEFPLCWIFLTYSGR